MEFVIFISMGLFCAFCAALLVWAAYHANDKNQDKQEE